MPQFARPISDISTASWTTAPLWSKLDEVSFNDLDFVTSPNNTNTTAELALSVATDPGVSAGHTIRYRYAKSAAGGNDRSITVQLVQGATLIASGLARTPTLTTFVADSFTLTAPEADAITDYAALRIRLVAGGTVSTGAPNRRSVLVSWVEVEVPSVLVVGTVALKVVPLTGLPVLAPVPAAGTVAADALPLTGSAVGAQAPSGADPFAYWRLGAPAAGVPGTSLTRSFKPWRRGEAARTLTGDVAPPGSFGVVAAASVGLQGRPVASAAAALGTVAVDALPLTGTASTALAAATSTVIADAVPLTGTTTGGLGAAGATGTVIASARTLVGGAVASGAVTGGFGFDWFRAEESLPAVAERNAGALEHWRHDEPMIALTRSPSAGPTGLVAPRAVSIVGTAVVALIPNPSGGVVAGDAVSLVGATIAATGASQGIVTAASVGLVGTITGAQAAGPGLGTVREGAVHLSGSLPEFYDSALFGSGLYGGEPGTIVTASGGTASAITAGVLLITTTAVIGRHAITAVVDRREVAVIGQTVVASWGATGTVVAGDTLRLDSAPHVDALVTALGTVTTGVVDQVGGLILGLIPPDIGGFVVAGIVEILGPGTETTWGAEASVLASVMTLAGSSASAAMDGYGAVLVGVIGTSGRAVVMTATGPAEILPGVVAILPGDAAVGLPGAPIGAVVAVGVVALTGRIITIGGTPVVVLWTAHRPTGAFNATKPAADFTAGRDFS